MESLEDHCLPPHLLLCPWLQNSGQQNEIISVSLVIIILGGHLWNHYLSGTLIITKMTVCISAATSV